MATAKVLTRGEWDVRAEQLAEAKDARGTAQYLHECADGRGHVYRVPSRSTTGSYEVVAWGDGRIECPCTAGAYGRPCRHAGAVVHAERQRVAGESETCDAFDSWLKGWEW